ncbi:MAG: phosphatidylinositol-specific phospholipase C1-like protein [Verrucomicrobia bacterium]|nr:phosphatidylinositol-specific phospholipase C1-like protein [Cytophagales bacterium]
MKLITSLLLIVVLLFQHQPDVNNLPINHIQVIGSHNSYKIAIDPVLFKMLSKYDSANFSKIEYSHVPLSEQLNMGLLNLEIDIYADTKGGKYAHPKGLTLAKNQVFYDTTLMKEPGFKVFHIQDIDFRSHCPTFRQCLTELKKWSDAHKNHNPIFITMNAKDDEIKSPLGFVVPEKFTPEVYDELDKTILENLGKEKLLMPDQVRGKHKTLEEAVLANNWPSVKNARGKFIFILDETGDKIAAYVKNHPSLQGRVLFANAKVGTPEAAFLIMNNAKKDNIAEMVKKGYIVRTRADSDTKEARLNDKSSFEAACKSGAQIITTDYYRKSTHFTSDYVISFENNTYFRENPLFKK